MLARDITYTDFFTEEERTEIFYFNLTKAELIKMSVKVDGGMQKYLETIIAEEDQDKLLEEFDKLVLAAYGERQEDGRFLKSPEVSAKFAQTAAYQVLIEKLITEANYAAEFVLGAFPANAELEQVVKEKILPVAPETQAAIPPPPTSYSSPSV